MGKWTKSWSKRNSRKMKKYVEKSRRLIDNTFIITPEMIDKLGIDKTVEVTVEHLKNLGVDIEEKDIEDIRGLTIQIQNMQENVDMMQYIQRRYEEVRKLFFTHKLIKLLQTASIIILVLMVIFTNFEFDTEKSIVWVSYVIIMSLLSSKSRKIAVTEANKLERDITERMRKALGQ